MLNINKSDSMPVLISYNTVWGEIYQYFQLIKSLALPFGGICTCNDSKLGILHQSIISINHKSILIKLFLNIHSRKLCKNITKNS